MTKPNNVALILNCFLLLASTYIVPAAADKAFVMKTCQKIDNVDLCSTILLSDPRSVNATSVAELASIALDLAIKSTDYAVSQASGLADKYAGLPEQEVVDLCEQFWSDAADNLRDAQTDASQQNYSKAADLASDAQDGADSCEKAFADKGLKSVTADLDKSIHDQSGLASDILDLLDVP